MKRWADFTSKKYTIIVLDIISVVCFASCAFLPMSWGVILLLFIGSLCQNMEQPPYHALVADMTLTAGALYSSFGSQAAWTVVLTLTAGFTVLATVMDRADHKAYPNLL